MKLFYVLIILLIFNNCSFDNKTGIWKNDSSSIIEKDEFSEFKDLSIKNTSFNKIIPINNINLKNLTE